MVSQSRKTVQHREERSEIAIDETKIKLRKKWHYLWAAIDIHTREILAVHLTSSRSSLDALLFLKKVLKFCAKSCANKPKVYVDGGPWYPWTFQRLGLPWQHITFGKRNAIEQWFSILKHRIKRFYRRWPHNSSIHSALSYVYAFASIYNFLLGGA